MNIEPRRHPLERSAGGMPHRGSCVSSGGKTKGVDQKVNPLLCDSGAIRTRDPQLRRLLLYPAELRNLAIPAGAGMQI